MCYRPKKNVLSLTGTVAKTKRKKEGRPSIVSVWSETAKVAFG